MEYSPYAGDQTGPQPFRPTFSLQISLQVACALQPLGHLNLLAVLPSLNHRFFIMYLATLFEGNDTCWPDR